MGNEFYKDKIEHDWRLKFKVDDYFEHPEYWSYEVELPQWAKEIYETTDFKPTSALDFYDDLFNDEDISEKVSDKQFLKGSYCPKILKLYPKPKERWTDKEIKKMEDWESENLKGIELEEVYKACLKDFNQYKSSGKNVGPFGEYIYWSDKKKELKKLEGLVYLAKRDLEDYYANHSKRPKFILTKLDYIFKEKENLWNTISYANKDDFLIIRPASYAGSSMTDKYARLLHALVIEIDELRPEHDGIGLQNLIYTWEREYRKLPRPTYIVCSGSGIHLYFIFETPIPLFSNVMEQLTNMKYYLVSQYWTDAISKIPIQPEALTQAFRVVGSYAKDNRAIVSAFKVGEKINLEYLNSFVPEELKVNPIYKRKGLSLQEAKEKYPDWYEDRIVKHKPKDTWTNSPNLYYWWREKILTEAKVGCRGYMLENLCSLALKCNISEEELDKDLEMLLVHLERLTRPEDVDNHFTEEDVKRAKTTYINKKYNAYARRTDYLRTKFEPFGIKIPETKRNGNKQKDWLQSDVVYIKDSKTGNLKRSINPCKNNRNLILQEMREKEEIHGRPTKQSIVQAWKKANPMGTKYQCAKETGLSKNTVKKWWNDSEK